MDFPIRINKYLSELQYCSRRAADKLIAEGKVKINGKGAIIGQKVNAGDRVEVDLPTVKKISAGRVYLAYHKPAGIDSHEVKNAGDQNWFPTDRAGNSRHYLRRFGQFISWRIYRNNLDILHRS